MGFRQDVDTFVTRAREVAEAIPDSLYLELADAAHLAPVTDPPRVIEPVLSFFAGVGAETEVDRSGPDPVPGNRVSRGSASGRSGQSAGRSRCSCVCSGRLDPRGVGPVRRAVTECVDPDLKVS
jgi:hypothetical protein